MTIILSEKGKLPQRGQEGKRHHHAVHEEVHGYAVQHAKRGQRAGLEMVPGGWQ